MFRDTFTIVKTKEGLRAISFIASAVLITLLIIEATFDLKATTAAILLPFVITNVLLALVTYFSKVSITTLKILQVLLIYVTIEIHFLFNPTIYHVIVFWISFIPISALIIQGKRLSVITLIISVITTIGNGFYLNETFGSFNYQIDVHVIGFLVGGLVFSLTFYFLTFILYFLLEKYFKNITEQSKEIELLNDDLKAYNSMLEANLDDQTIKLNRIAFNNSHLVRAPLVKIMSAAEILSNGHNDEVVEIIKKSAKELDAVIREVAYISHEESE